MNSYATRQPKDSTVASETDPVTPGMALAELRRVAEQIIANVESVIDGKHEAVQTALVVLPTAGLGTPLRSDWRRILSGS